MRPLFALIAALALTGCPKQQAATASAEAEAPPAPARRFSGATGTFVDTLMAQGVSGFTVADDGMPIIYDALRFAEDGTFAADVSMLTGDEPFACTEAGRWKLDGDKAVSATEGAINFELDSTDCPGRSAGTTWRTRTRLAGGDVQMDHR